MVRIASIATAHTRITTLSMHNTYAFWGLRPVNPARPRRDASFMSFDVMEEGTPCDYCGQPVGFMDDDEAVCPTCRAEYINMDFERGDLEGENPLEY